MEPKATKSDNPKKAKMIACFKETWGNVSAACTEVGINRATHYRWMREDPDYKQAWEDTKEALIDFAEHQLAKNIKAGDNTSLIFFLKTQGKSRGYVERTETKDVTERKSVVDAEAIQRMVKQVREGKVTLINNEMAKQQGGVNETYSRR